MAVHVFVQCNEVPILGSTGNVNIALGKPAYQSSTVGDEVASRAVDGNKNPNMLNLSCSGTWKNLNAWWAIDLGSVRSIKTVSVTGRLKNGKNI